ncbi:MAG TPA: hypothetical protein VGQ66_04155 [Candidatus Limnocylindria bacterium]|nr:hypothetical protein [Candidatus Limnocylindria bacterium]
MGERGSATKGVREMAARLGLRRPVRREGAEHYLFLTLVSFAATVMATRVYLEVTGYPRIGGGELHIAHALFGGFFLFVAALLPIVLAGRRVYRVAAVVGGIGIGLFIDEVGKFITTQNDYFYPAAAPLIYATFLLAVIVYLRVRRRVQPDPRSLLLTSLQLMEEAVDDDLQDHERDALRYRLGAAVVQAPLEEQRRLASALLAFVESQELDIAPDAVNRFQPVFEWWASRRDQWIGGRGARAALVVALFISGMRAVIDLGVALTQIGGVDPSTSTRLFSLDMLHLVVEGIAGGLLLAGALLMALTRGDRLGASLAEYGLLVALSLADLASFYLRQFATIEVALLHGLLLFGVVAYRRQLRADARAVTSS